MGWTKADREKFLKTTEEARGLMPTEVISRQQALFEDIVETDVANSKYQKIRIVLMYPKLIDNDKGNPIAKQSARFVARRCNADDAGDRRRADDDPRNRSPPRMAGRQRL